MPLENEGFVEQNSNTYKSEYKTKNAGCKIYDNFTLIVEVRIIFMYRLYIYKRLNCYNYFLNL